MHRHFLTFRTSLAEHPVAKSSGFMVLAHSAWIHEAYEQLNPETVISLNERA
jgi:hypothetical protein